jgi:hypothetical protein
MMSNRSLVRIGGDVGDVYPAGWRGRPGAWVPSTMRLALRDQQQSHGNGLTRARLPELNAELEVARQCPHMRLANWRLSLPSITRRPRPSHPCHPKNTTSHSGAGRSGPVRASICITKTRGYTLISFRVNRSLRHRTNMSRAVDGRALHSRLRQRLSANCAMRALE